MKETPHSSKPRDAVFAAEYCRVWRHRCWGPGKAGVSVHAHTRSGDVIASGLSEADGVLVNSACGHAKAMLNPSIESAYGSINLQVAND